MATIAKKSDKAKAVEAHGYEFGGPLGATFLTTVLPILCYATTFLCNDISGCPVPSALSPSTLTIEKLKKEVGWPAEGVWGLTSWDVSFKVLGYYALALILYKVLPGDHVEGVELASGGRLKYKNNAFYTTLTTFAICAAGTITQGADFPVWTFMYNNYLQILTTNIIISYSLATFVYVRSFSVKPGNAEHRELAAGGHSGNMIYDWFIGRELNPRTTIPLIGEIDIKSFCELRPGLMGWILMDFAFIAHQYKTYGVVTDSILIITAFQALYVLDSYWMEPAILTTMDITTDGFGLMLAFGDLVWVPFVYSWQCRYLSVYPLSLGVAGCAGVFVVQALGYYIFRSSNNEKNRFRTNPDDPRVAHLKYMETKSGSKLLTSGWWGVTRHPNYMGDWIMSWTYCLPTGIAGYLMQHSSVAATSGQSAANGTFTFKGPAVHTTVVQGEAKGYGMIITYFYILYFGILLVHRELRDEDKCLRKYGDDWKRYTKIVKYRIIPGIY